MYALALAAITTVWQNQREQLKARSGNPFHTPQRGADRSAGQRSRQGPGDPGARVVRQPSPGSSFPSERTIYNHRSLHCTSNTPRAFQPNSSRSLSLGKYYSIGLLSSTLSTLPQVPAKSTTEESNREVLLRCGTERRAEDDRACNCQRGCRGSQQTEHPQPPSLVSLAWVHG